MRIRLLGDLEIVSSQGQPARFATRKSGLVLAAMGLAGDRGLRREQLAEAFWPRRGHAQARNSLRQALVEIRRVFPDGSMIRVEGDQDHVALLAEASDVDARLFDQMLEAGQLADLALAATLYRGDLLAGQAISDGLDDWFGPYRSHYLQKALRLVEELSLLPTVASEDACVGLAERLIAADPASEPAHRALIRVHLRRAERMRRFASSSSVGRP